MRHETISDFIAIGAGPFNLSLACLSDPIVDLNGYFLDKRPHFDWHPGLLLQDTTLQIPFLADLVTMADPTSPFSFLNYLKEQGRLYSFYIRENVLLLRNEYNQYCQWAINKLSNIHFKTRVDQLEYDKAQQCYIVRAVCTQSGQPKIYRTRKLVLGIGTVPDVPDCCKSLDGPVLHTADYLNHKKMLQSRKSITILGSGQSAAEVYYDLLQDIDQYDYTLNWMTRSPRFFPLEYSKLTLEMTSPEYVDYFYNLPPARRDQLIKHQKQLYKGINNDLIGDIYDLLYTKRLTHEIKVNLRTHSTLQKAAFNTEKDCFELHFYQHEQEKHYQHSTSALVLATGYRPCQPNFLKGITSRIQWDEQGRFAVNRNYSIDRRGSDIFVQNAELHTHGFVTPDLGMGCYRNSYIIKEMSGKDPYKIEKRIAFQQFAVSEAEEISPAALAVSEQCQSI